MIRQLINAILISLLSISVCVSGQEQAGKSEQSERQVLSKYEQFTATQHAVIVSRSYSIGKIEPLQFDVSALVAWKLGSPEKVYAVSINSLIIDFAQIKDLEEAIDKMIDAIRAQDFDGAGTTTLHYFSESGLRITYYARNDSEGARRNLYVIFKNSFIGQGPSTEPLPKMRALIVQARDKLISLGAK